MLENWTALEIVAGGFVAIAGAGFLLTTIGPMMYAWADRWLDRTRNKLPDGE
ncbi:hypothetical protein McpAg1_01570 [Methanocorpusculaceae archaeon Ag1]|uniref:Uncharacterized protein n=1 Tax=Methanorbis furvi TaxID=3028299 RepID=A0AAE4MC48_9EURY|nr:hypothetical protein [Methanocorpusculaceae archaeon Ag1]